jgi:hypothetical protein
MEEVLRAAHTDGIPCDHNLKVAGAIAKAESGLNTAATGKNGPTPGCPNGSEDRGLWQINSCYHPQYDRACVYEAYCNGKAMFAISSHGTDWTPWSTYNSGAYRDYMAEAEAAYDKVCGSSSSSEAAQAAQAIAPEMAQSTEALNPISRDDVIDRGEQWISAGVLYCGSPNHQWDPLCGDTCNRVNNPAWNPYRSDCSGFVSWSWGTPPPGRVTWEYAPFKTDVSFVIDGNSLLPGDALNSMLGTPTDHQHMFLFKRWLVPGHSAVFLEEENCGEDAKRIESDVSIKGSTVFVSYFGTDYTAIRFKMITNDGCSAPNHVCGSLCCPQNMNCQTCLGG